MVGSGGIWWWDHLIPPDPGNGWDLSWNHLIPRTSPNSHVWRSSGGSLWNQRNLAVECGLASSFHMLRQGSWLVCIEWLGLVLRCSCRVTTRHQCLVVSSVIEVLPTTSCFLCSSFLWFVMICYAFFFLLSFLLRVELHGWCHLQAVELHKRYLVGN
jgi:hypothetical protein